MVPEDKKPAARTGKKRGRPRKNEILIQEENLNKEEGAGSPYREGFEDVEENFQEDDKSPTPPTSPTTVPPNTDLGVPKDEALIVDVEAEKKALDDTGIYESDNGDTGINYDPLTRLRAPAPPPQESSDEEMIPSPRAPPTHIFVLETETCLLLCRLHEAKQVTPSLSQPLISAPTLAATQHTLEQLA